MIILNTLLDKDNTCGNIHEYTTNHEALSCITKFMELPKPIVELISVTMEITINQNSLLHQIVLTKTN